MLNFDALDFSERRSEEVISFSWRSVYMRASGARELRIFSHFYILKLLFLSIFVGTLDTLAPLHKICVWTQIRKIKRNKRKCYATGLLSVQITCLSAYMYRQISKCTDKTPKKSIIGGNSPPPPPAPALATLMMWACHFGWTTNNKLNFIAFNG